jgi:hypothetical protein
LKNPGLMRDRRELFNKALSAYGRLSHGPNLHVSSKAELLEGGFPVKERARGCNRLAVLVMKGSPVRVRASASHRRAVSFDERAPAEDAPSRRHGRLRYVGF